MEKKILARFLCLSLCASMLFCACGSTSDTSSDTPEPLSYPFDSVIADTDRMIQEAVDQYNRS